MAFEYSYRFTERAEQDLDEILDYICNELKNPSAAAGLGKKIFEHIETLCAYPETGAIVQNESLSDKQIRKVVIDNYILYYKQLPDERNVCILRIVYGYRNLDAIIRAIK